MKCKVCGFRLSDEAKKCPMCGAMRGSLEAGQINQNANLPRYLCPSCKADIIGEHRFCPSCGKELSEVANMQDTKEQSKNNCIKCGAYLPMGAKFCSECGAKQNQTPINANSVANASGKMEETPLEAFEYEKRGNEYVLKKLKDTSLTDVVIPKVFSEIGKNAFSECSNLETITIPDSVTEIGILAFWDCSSLTSVTIPNSVTEIGAGAFFGCYFLRDITIPNSVTRIKYRAFAACIALKNITIPSSVNEIGDEAFAICGLKNVSIGNPNFKKYDIERVFDSSPSFKRIKIGNKIVKISDLK